MSIPKQEDFDIQAKVFLPNGQHKLVKFHSKLTVDQVKTHCFKVVPFFNGKLKNDFYIGVSQTEVILVEFQKFIRSHPKIEEMVSRNEVVAFGIYPVASKEKRKKSMDNLSTLARDDLDVAETGSENVSNDPDGWIQVTRRRSRRGSLGNPALVPPPNYSSDIGDKKLRSITSLNPVIEHDEEPSIQSIKRGNDMEKKSEIESPKALTPQPISNINHLEKSVEPKKVEEKVENITVSQEKEKQLVVEKKQEKDVEENREKEKEKEKEKENELVPKILEEKSDLGRRESKIRRHRSLENVEQVAIPISPPIDKIEKKYDDEMRKDSSNESIDQWLHDQILRQRQASSRSFSVASSASLEAFVRSSDKNEYGEASLRSRHLQKARFSGFRKSLDLMRMKQKENKEAKELKEGGMKDERKSNTLKRVKLKIKSVMDVSGVSGATERSPSEQSSPGSPLSLRKIQRSLSEPDLEAIASELNLSWIQKRDPTRNKSTRYSKIEEKRIQQLEAALSLELQEMKESMKLPKPVPLGNMAFSYDKKKEAVEERDTEFSSQNISRCDGWTVEKPEEIAFDEMLNYPLLYPDATAYDLYMAYFEGKEDVRHILGFHNEFGPLIITTLEVKSKSIQHFKALIRTQHGSDFVLFPSSLVKHLVIRSRPTAKEIVRTIDSRFLEMDMKITEVPSDKSSNFEKELLNFEMRLKMSNYKFGVLYVKEGQKKEEEMFGNETGSPAFDKFLETLGEKVALLDWKKYRAGLDVTKNATGTHSIYTCVEESEVMLHVSTLLPYKKNDLQQLERKRHIGNDICVIVYREGNDTDKYIPSTVESEFNHVLAVVDADVKDPQNPDDENDRFAVSFATKGDVAMFGPPIPSGFVFKRDSHLRSVLLKKLVNGEISSLRATTFASKMQRTRFVTYKNLFDTYSI